MRKLIVSVAVVAVFLSLMSLAAKAQGFNGGSTGADGALDLSTCSTSSCLVQVPESGVFNYTTVNIPQGKLLLFKSNLRNTPVIMLAQGAVTISGTISVANSYNGNNENFSVTGPGPGGFAGGASGLPGFGPGGGQNASAPHGKWIGPLSLVPIIGGSGAFSDGGAGGGAIVIASSASITLSITSTIDAGEGNCPFCNYRGSGGAIRLVSNSITVSGQLRASNSSNPPSKGVIRLEAPAGALSFTGFADPTPILSTTINPAIIADNNTPSLTITSIAGFAVPSYTTARPDIVDLLLPTQLSDPLSVIVHGHNIPVGTQVNMNVTGSAVTVDPVTLSGTLDSSAATLGVSGLNRTAVSTLYVFATFTPPSGGSLQSANPKGRDQVAKVRVEAAPGTKSRFVFLRSDGTVIDKSKVPRALLEYFGL
jgi:hypothetical protein